MAQTTTSKPRSHELLETIKNGQFFKISDTELLHQTKHCFSDELQRLTHAYAGEKRSPVLLPVNGKKPSPKPSEIVFGTNYDEVNRTLLGVLVFRWIHNNDYERFTRGQPEATRLTRESFEWLRRYFDENNRTPEDIFALVLSIVVNDLGKDPHLAEDYYARTHRPLHGENHDTVLLEAANVGMIECLDMLDESHRADVMLGLELGSELNAGQLAQAENLPINLEGLLNMRDCEYAFNLKFMEQMLDVAGAIGHLYADGAKNLGEPVFQAFKTVHEVSLDIINRKCNLREGYDMVLTKRGDMLHRRGYRRLDVRNRDERALLRLLTMGRTATVEQAELFEKSFYALGLDTRTSLVNGLNVDGDKFNETAVLPYYMPAMLAESLENTKGSPKRQEALTSLMRYLARVLVWTEMDSYALTPLRESMATDSFMNPGDGSPGVVIERNLMQARKTIGTPEFKNDPGILDLLDAPKGHLIQRRRTIFSHANPNAYRNKNVEKRHALNIELRLTRVGTQPNRGTVPGLPNFSRTKEANHVDVDIETHGLRRNETRRDEMR